MLLRQVVSCVMLGSSSGILSRPLISCLVSCYMASHKQARFVDVSDRKLGSGFVLYILCFAPPREPAALAEGGLNIIYIKIIVYLMHIYTE